MIEMYATILFLENLPNHYVHGGAGNFHYKINVVKNCGMTWVPHFGKISFLCQYWDVLHDPHWVNESITDPHWLNESITLH